MGRSARDKPLYLGAKLLQIREALGLSQTGMLKRLGLDERVGYSAISGYELGRTEPTLLVLLAYARIAGVSTDVLIDDELDLPDYLPTVPRVKGTNKRHK